MNRSCITILGLVAALVGWTPTASAQAPGANPTAPKAVQNALLEDAKSEIQILNGARVYFPATLATGEKCKRSKIGVVRSIRVLESIAEFKEIKRRMKELGVRIIMIDTAADNHAAIRFFQKKGFGNAQAHVYMTLNLSRKKRKATRKKNP